MKKSLPWLMLLGVLLLIGCASKKDANEKNFSEALNSYLAKKGQLCLGIPSAWPVDLNEAERRGGMGTAAEMAALEKAGLVRSHETETEYTPPLSSRPVRTKVLRYELTDRRQEFYREKDRLGFGRKQTGPGRPLLRTASIGQNRQVGRADCRWRLQRSLSFLHV